MKKQAIMLSALLDDLQIAEQSLRKFEQRYWLSSDVFYELFSQGSLDDGNNTEEFAEWAGHYKLKLKREAALQQFSHQRAEQLRRQSEGNIIRLHHPHHPQKMKGVVHHNDAPWGKGRLGKLLLACHFHPFQRKVVSVLHPVLQSDQK